MPLARQALRKLLPEPILFMHEDGGYRLKGATRLGALLFDEMAAPKEEGTRIKMASPQGLARFASAVRIPLYDGMPTLRAFSSTVSKRERAASDDSSAVSPDL